MKATDTAKLQIRVPLFNSGRGLQPSRLLRFGWQAVPWLRKLPTMTFAKAGGMAKTAALQRR